MNNFINISKRRNNDRQASGWDTVVATSDQLNRIKQVAASSFNVPFTVRCYAGSDSFFISEQQVQNILENLPQKEKQTVAELPF